MIVLVLLQRVVSHPGREDRIRAEFERLKPQMPHNGLAVELTDGARYNVIAPPFEPGGMWQLEGGWLVRTHEIADYGQMRSLLGHDLRL